MTTINAFIKRNPVLTYFALTFAVSWGGLFIAVGPNRIPMTAEELKAMPLLPLMAVLAGPSVAGILLTGLVYGKAGFRQLLSRLFKWRVGVRWYMIALLTAPLSIIGVLLVLSIFWPEFFPGIFTADSKADLLLNGIVAGLVVGIFEELGWTGFAIPRMRQRFSALATGLIVGLLWGAWHFPLFWESGSFSSAFLLALLCARLFSWLPAYRLLMVWVYDRSESLFVTILMHASLAASQLILIAPLALSGASILIQIVVWAGVLWVVVGVVALVNGGQISRPGKPPAKIGAAHFTAG